MANERILYRLGVAPSEDAGEGEDCDEWYPKLSFAKSRRAKLIAENPMLDNHRYGRDFEIERVELVPLPRKAMALALLNRRKMFVARQIVVDAYVPTRTCEPMRGVVGQVDVDLADNHLPGIVHAEYEYGDRGYPLGGEE